MPQYSFGFVCEHGSLKRQCLTCEYIEVIDDLKKVITGLQEQILEKDDQIYYLTERCNELEENVD